jgi:phosphoglycerate kinase
MWRAILERFKMPALRVMQPATLARKRVLVRVDYNVPMQQGQVSDISRIERTVPTLRALLEQGAKVILLSHLGRPQQRDAAYSLAPVLSHLQRFFPDAHVSFIEDCLGEKVEQAIAAMNYGSILLLENVRFYAEEEAGDKDFAAALATLADAYVDDAFACAHRAHASITGIAECVPAYAGLLLALEVEALERYLDQPKRPLAAIIGGAKISTKLALIENLLPKVDLLMVGGAMANSFLVAQGHPVGTSLYEPEMVATAQRILQQAGAKLLLPSDVVVTDALDHPSDIQTVAVSAIPADRMVVDCGPATLAALCQALAGYQMVIWNGPLGVFEVPEFAKGTLSLAKFIAEATSAGGLESLAGGGDSVAALTQTGLIDQFSYVSTAGGAFLEWLEGKSLPGVAVLYQVA